MASVRATERRDVSVTKRNEGHAAQMLIVCVARAQSAVRRAVNRAQAATALLATARCAGASPAR